MNWTQHPGHGPGAELLGELTGRRVVELGCGPGDTIAHLAVCHDADATGVDISPAQISRARARFSHIPGLRFTVSDAATWLTRGTAPMDVCCSVFGALDFSPPERLIPLIATRLRPGGRLAFSVRHPATTPHDLGRRRWDRLALPRGGSLPIVRYVLTATKWVALLRASGFTIDSLLEVSLPAADGEGPCCLLVTARRSAPGGSQDCRNTAPVERVRR